jgi:hypothetical protein
MFLTFILLLFAISAALLKPLSKIMPISNEILLFTIIFTVLMCLSVTGIILFCLLINKIYHRKPLDHHPSDYTRSDEFSDEIYRNIAQALQVKHPDYQPNDKKDFFGLSRLFFLVGFDIIVNCLEASFHSDGLIGDSTPEDILQDLLSYSNLMRNRSVAMSILTHEDQLQELLQMSYYSKKQNDFIDCFDTYRLHNPIGLSLMVHDTIDCPAFSNHISRKRWRSNMHDYNPELMDKIYFMFVICYHIGWSDRKTDDSMFNLWLALATSDDGRANRASEVLRIILTGSVDNQDGVECTELIDLWEHPEPRRRHSLSVYKHNKNILPEYLDANALMDLADEGLPYTLLAENTTIGDYYE